MSQESEPLANFRAAAAGAGGTDRANSRSGGRHQDVGGSVDGAWESGWRRIVAHQDGKQTGTGRCSHKLANARVRSTKVHFSIRLSSGSVALAVRLRGARLRIFSEGFILNTRTDPEETLAKLGLSLSAAPKPVAAYIPWRRTGNLLYISGQIPMAAGQLVARGSVPGQVSIEQAQQCARQCVLNGLAVVKDAIGSLSGVRQAVRVGCFVASEPGFFDQPKVANGASELLVQIFGDAGKHARAAVGSIALPLGAPVEVEFLFEVSEERPG
jgi:enamine deaminase RidA (YjgF/YER057c/UK114 family)